MGLNGHAFFLKMFKELMPQETGRMVSARPIPKEAKRGKGGEPVEIQLKNLMRPTRETGRDHASTVQ